MATLTIKRQSQVTRINQQQKKIITCYECKETGHYRSQCPLLNEKKNNKKQSNAFNVVFLSGEFSKSDFYIDSGASTHMTANDSPIYPKNPDYSSSLPEIIIANKTKVPVLCSGEIDITTSYNYNITIKNALCIPSLTTNLLSVSVLIKNGNSVVFEPKRCIIRNKDGDLVADAKLVDGVYKVNLETKKCLLTYSTVNGEIWHKRLGHINSCDMNKMKSGGMVDGMEYPDTFTTSKLSCKVYCEGKQSRLPFSAGSRSSDVLEIIHSDICGPMESKSIGGARYFLLFIDDYSRMTHIYFLKNKSEVLKHFKEYKAMVENSQNKKIKILRTDNGCEYCSNEFENYLKQEGVIHQKTNPYTPEQNGLNERSNRTIVERARCMLFEAGLDKKFWAEAANTAVFLKNRSVASGIEKTPYEVWTGKKPNLQHIRIFGSTVMAHVPKEKRNKWDRKSKEHILVGYSENVKGYRIYDPEKNTVITSRDVVIQEKAKPEDTVPIYVENTDSVGESVLESVKLDCDQSSSSESEYMDIETSETGDLKTEYVSHDPETSDTSQSKNEMPNSQSNTREKRQRKIPERYGYANACTMSIGEDELTYAEAISGPEKQQWLQAITEERQSFEDNQVWEVVDAPDN